MRTHFQVNKSDFVLSSSEPKWHFFRSEIKHSDWKFWSILVKDIYISLLPFFFFFFLMGQEISYISSLATSGEEKQADTFKIEGLHPETLNVISLSAQHRDVTSVFNISILVRLSCSYFVSSIYTP